jgi:hypothetical protein
VVAPVLLPLCACPVLLCLQKLNLAFNALTGSVPAYWTRVGTNGGFYSLDLSYNQFTVGAFHAVCAPSAPVAAAANGAIAGCILSRCADPAVCCSLLYLMLPLQGSIPDSGFDASLQLPALVFLSFNQLTGTIPSCEYLRLSLNAQMCVMRSKWLAGSQVVRSRSITAVAGQLTSKSSEY